MYTATVGFLPIFYAAGFLFVAFCGYVCLSIAADLHTLGKRVFVAILAFGACSYIGFIAVILAVGSSPLRVLLQGQFRGALFALAYVAPGLTGSWFALRAFKALKPAQPQE
jgi:hypothetical protein